MAYRLKNSFEMSSCVSCQNWFAEGNVNTYENYVAVNSHVISVYKLNTIRMSWYHNTRLQAIHIIIT